MEATVHREALNYRSASVLSLQMPERRIADRSIGYAPPPARGLKGCTTLVQIKIPYLVPMLRDETNLQYRDSYIFQYLGSWEPIPKVLTRLAGTRQSGLMPD